MIPERGDQIGVDEEYTYSSYQSETVMTVDSGKNYESHSVIMGKGTRTIVNIIQRSMGVVWIIDDQWTS
jgi:hypothetical protein